MALGAVVNTLLVPLVASRAGKIAVVLAVRIHFLRILRLGFGCNSVIPAVALHTGLVAVLVDFERSFCCISVAGIALDAVACMTVGKKLGCSEDFTLLARRVQAHGGKAEFFVVGADRTAAHHQREFDFDETGLETAFGIFRRTLEKLNGC